MSKRVIGIVLVVILVIAAILGVVVYNKNNKKEDNKSNIVESTNENKDVKNEENTNDVDDEDEKETSDNKTLVVYFSAQSHTKAVAEKIAEDLDADIFEIEPEDEYTSDDLDWTDDESRVTKEHDDESLRDVKLVTTSVDDWEDYDTVLIGYPIWWGIAAWPVNTFVKANDFEGKTVVPFCTSMSSSLGESGELLEKEANGGNWLEGHRFNSNTSDSDIRDFVESLK